MIKNDTQFIRTRERLKQIQTEIRNLESIYAGIELEFWSDQIRNEAIKLQEELQEYRLLRTLSFKDAVEGPLQEPIQIENIGEILAKLRIAAKMTQEEMAEKLGWQQSNLSRFENENYSSQTIGKISEYLEALGIWLYVTPALSERPAKVTYHLSKRQRMEMKPVPGLSVEAISEVTTSASPEDVNYEVSSTAFPNDRLVEDLFAKTLTSQSKSMLV